MRRLLLAAALLLPAGAAALDVPYLSGRVNDEAGVLGAAASQSLEAELKAYEDKTGQQIVVLTLASLEGEPLEDFSLKVARTWKLGRKGKDDGILILVARDDHKVRIEVGYGLEGPLPDALCGRIIRREMVPRFRAGDYAGGVSAGAQAVIAALAGTYSPSPEPRRSRSQDISDMTFSEKLLMSAFVFGILGLFEFVGVFTPGAGWVLYFFLIPFWAAFPMAIWGAHAGLAILAAHLIGFPLLRSISSRTGWGKNLSKNFNQHGGSGTGWSSGGSSGWSSGGGGFSGGGGSFGGGGSSGSW